MIDPPLFGVPSLLTLDLTGFAPGTFRPDRIRSIADRFGVNGDMALENILYGALCTVLPIFRRIVLISSFSSRVQQRAPGMSIISRRIAPVFITDRLDGTHQRVLDALRRR